MAMAQRVIAIYSYLDPFGIGMAIAIEQKLQPHSMDEIIKEICERHGLIRTPRSPRLVSNTNKLVLNVHRIQLVNHEADHIFWIHSNDSYQL